MSRLEDHRFLTGRARYVADLNRAGQAHMAVVRADHAHARIIGIDCDDAKAAEGVLGVHTVADLDADNLGLMPCPAAADHLSYKVVPPRPALARGRVRHVGDPLCVVIAESPEAALAAAELVTVETEPLAAVIGFDQAEAADAPQIWDDAPGNLAFRFEAGDAAATADAFAQARYVVELEVTNNRVCAAPLEPRAGIGEYDPANERFTLTCTAQGVHGIRKQLASAVFGMPEDKIRVLAPDVGGGFGLKNFLYPEWIVLLWAARRHGRPVKWVASRGEDFAAAAHGRASRVRGRLALDAEGNFLALDADMVGDMGAYLSGGAPGIASKAFPTAIGGVYAIPQISMRSRGVFTNTGPVDAYRGAGKPEANYITERLIELAARRHGFDPVELRRKNAFAGFPHTTARGHTIDSGRIRDAITDAERLAGWPSFAQRRDDAARRGRLRGLGFGCFLETSRGTPEEGAEVRFARDGRVELCLGTESNGQGHETAFIQVAADRLGLAVSDFRFVQADTGETRMGHGHGGARSMHMGGAAMAKALDGVIGKARIAAGRLLQADPEGLEFSDARFTAAQDGASIALLEVAAADGVDLDSFAKIEDAPFTFPMGCHAAEVEVNADTGEIALKRYIAVDDYGRLINPRLTEGQVVGGIAQGIGQALGEDVRYDAASGQLVSGSLMDYSISRARELPDFEIHLDGVATAANPLGVKGSGQAGAIAAPQTIVNAVLNALAPLGIEHIDMPLTAENIWRAIDVARARRRA